jgi:hypothetical protein
MPNHSKRVLHIPHLGQGKLHTESLQRAYVLKMNEITRVRSSEDVEIGVAGLLFSASKQEGDGVIRVC